LEGCPKKITGGFWCHECPNLKSLKGIGKISDRTSVYLGGCENLESIKDLNASILHILELCDCKKLKSLEGCPDEIIDGLDCDNCESLVDLKGAPNKVQDMHCNGCKNLKSLEGLPDKLDRLYLENCTSLKNFEALKKHKDSNLRIYTNNIDIENEIKQIYI
jgi:hypothetical protein